MNHWSRKIVFLSFAFLWLYPGWGHASHNCPKPPKKGGFFGFLITTTFLPSATAAAVTRSLNTSGCKEGHPSNSFYKPDVTLDYLKDNLDFVAEETAQGQGLHLQTLAMLLGCPADEFSVFAVTLQRNYLRIFPASLDGNPTKQALHARDQLTEVMAHTPLLQTRCANNPVRS